MQKVKVIVWGAGRVGCNATRLIMEKNWVEVVGAIDIDKQRVGEDLGDLAGTNKKLGVVVTDDPDAVLSGNQADVVLHVTAPKLDETESQIMKAVSAGCNVISMADIRLMHPWILYPELGKRIDEAAKKNGVTVLETGRAPGFMWDLVPIFFTAVCEKVNKIKMDRLGGIKGAGKALVEPMGIGRTVEEFNAGASKGEFDYFVPAKTSVTMIAEALGWELDEVTLKMEPLTSDMEKELTSDYKIEAGKVCGVRELYTGIKEGEAVIIIDSKSLVDPEGENLEVGTTILFDADPRMEVIVNGFGTGRGVENWARPVNHIPQVMAAQPGLVTVRELPVASALE